MHIDYMPLIPSKDRRRGARGFLNYVQYRDQHLGSEHEPNVRGMLDYVAFRDTSSPGQRLFDYTGTVGKRERVALGDYIERSTARDTAAGGPRSSTNNHGWYSIIISPEKANGLDLRRLSRAAVDQLHMDVGGRGIPPWVAAEHRNTAHPHVHLIMAGRVEVAQGRFRTVLITRARRSRMQAAIDEDLAQQRDACNKRRESVIEGIGRAAMPDQTALHNQDWLYELLPWTAAGHKTRHAAHWFTSGSAKVAHLTGRLARRYQREAEDEARRRGYSSAREQRESELGRERAA
jgi:hypothetical protein